jgi:hypothetical protein
MKILKSRGPRTDPCGTPDNTIIIIIIIIIIIYVYIEYLICANVETK